MKGDEDSAGGKGSEHKGHECREAKGILGEYEVRFHGQLT